MSLLPSEGAFYLGIDGGQSSTEALIGDESGRILGRGLAGPCNHISGPEALSRFQNAITTAVRGACEDAGLPYGDMVFAGACLGLSGGPDDKAEHIRQIIRSQHYKITHDAEIALTGALSGDPGIIVIAGTGSIAFGRNRDGRSARAGGWGYLFGDEGGAWDVARRALRSALAMEEGWGPTTALRLQLLQMFEASSANELLHRFYTPAFPRSRVATFAPLVDAAAQAGDEVAQRVLQEAAAELVRYVAGLHGTLFAQSAPTGFTQSVPVGTIGGVFRSDLLRTAFARLLRDQTGCTAQLPARTPGEGAVIEAARLSRAPTL